MSSKTINITLKVWRQKDETSEGKLVTYDAKKIPTDASFLEMLDIVNEEITLKGDEPIAFDHDCREGICGTCGAMVNGKAHGPLKGITLCQLHMRSFKTGDTIVIEPFRAKSLPVVKDLVVDRSAFDRVITAGGYISCKTGSAQDANNMLIQKENSDASFDAAACIGCSACVAACPNASASLFVAAKVTHLSLVPQGIIERKKRVKQMVKQMDDEGFGNCSNHYQCEAACPKEISVETISKMNCELLKSSCC